MKLDNKSQFFPKVWAKNAKAENIANPFMDESGLLPSYSNKNIKNCSGAKVAYCFWVREPEETA